MTNIYEKLKITLMGVGVIAIAVLVPIAVRWSGSLYPSRTVTVSAEGKTTIPPDIATVSFSVLTQGSDPAKLEEDNAKMMTSAISFVKEQGMEAKDIATSSYNLSPNYEYNKDRRTTYISGYTLTQTVNLKIRDFKKVAPILGGLSERGVNQISSVNFSIEDPNKYLSSARNEAFTKALSKAQEMTHATGAHLGAVLNFSDYPNVSQPYPMYKSAGVGMGGASSSIAPPIEPGTQDLTVQVSVTYELN